MSGYQTGGLHTGGVAQPAPGHTHGPSGALHPGTGTGMGPNVGTGAGMGGQNVAPVAETHDTRDRRSSHSSSSKVQTNAGDKAGAVEKAVNTYGRIMSLLAILGALAGTLLYLAALAALQRQANQLGAVTGAGYSETFQSSLQVPYPGDGPDQFGFWWYIGAVQLFVAMLCLFTLCLPQRILQRFKSATMVLLGYCLVLFTYQTQSLLYLHRNNAIKNFFSGRRILICLIGAILIAVFDGLTLLNLSLLKETNRDLLGPGGKRVAEEAHHASDDRDYDTHHQHRGPGAV